VCIQGKYIEEHRVILSEIDWEMFKHNQEKRMPFSIKASLDAYIVIFIYMDIIQVQLSVL